MTEIIPFPGLRFSCAPAADLSAVVAPPYDVISPAQQQSLLQRDPHNIVRLDRGDDLPGDNGTGNKYTRAASLLAEWRNDGVLMQDDAPCLYVYEQEFSDQQGHTRKRSGLHATVRLQDYGEGGVRPHEFTKEAPKRDRLNLLRATRANLSSIFSLCDDSSGTFDSLLEDASSGSPLATATGEEGAVNRLWRVNRPEAIRRFQNVLAPLPLFLADGHHRYETALDYRSERRAAAASWSGDEPENFTMMTIVNTRHPGLVIFPTHRMLQIDAPIDWDRVHDALRQCFECEEVVPALLSEDLEQANAHTFGLCARGCGFRLRLMDRDRLLPGLEAGKSADYNQLEVTILHSVIIDHLLVAAGIDREQVAIHYTADANEAITRAQTGEFTMSFLLQPTRMEQVLAVASSGEKMPSKSTYFYPKVITGMVMRLLHSDQ